MNSEAEITGTFSSGKIEFPLDMREWVDGRSIAESTRAEIDRLDWSNPELISFLERHPSFHPRALLQVLTYAYATGVFASSEISVLCRSDEVVRQLSECEPIEPGELTLFRRRNRGLLKCVLASVVRNALRDTPGFDRGIPIGFKKLLIDDALVRLNIARQFDDEE